MSTRFNTVHSGRAPHPGPPRFTTVVFDMSKTTGKTPGSSRSIRHHPGPSRWTTVQPPVLPGSPRSMDRGEPGSTGSPVGLGHNLTLDGKLWPRDDNNAAFVYLLNLLPWHASLESVTMCVPISWKPFLIG